MPKIPERWRGGGGSQQREENNTRGGQVATPGTSLPVNAGKWFIDRWGDYFNEEHAYKERRGGSGFLVTRKIQL